jgi:ABC-type bacteriocin/lantibiotic exporter with double-glycine peptidase domain
MVLRLHGRIVSLDHLRDLAVSGRDATNAQKLIEIGGTFGLRGRAVSVDLDQLDLLDRGAILHWNFSHFVVLERVRRGQVTIVDPASGRRRVSADEFGRCFTGVALLFDPTAKFTPTPRGARRRSRYGALLLQEKAFFSQALLATICTQLLGLAAPLMTKFVIDDVIARQNGRLLLVVAGAAGVIVLIQAWAAGLRSQLSLYLRARIESKTSSDLVERLVRLPYEFFQRRSTSDLVARVEANSAVRDILASTTVSVAVDATSIVVYVGVLSWADPFIGILALALGALQTGAHLTFRALWHDRRRDVQAARVRTQSHLVETLTAIETLKSMGAERRAAEIWRGLFAQQQNVAITQSRRNAWADGVNAMMRTGATLGLLVAAAFQALRGRLTPGDVVAITAMAAMLFTALDALAGAVAQFQSAGLPMKRLDEIYRTAVAPPLRAASAPGDFGGGITVDHVSFRYGPVSPWIVRNVSTEIRPLEFVAIVGRSGAGKSTLARLLIGLSVPTEGHVRYSGLVANAQDAVPRAGIGVVPQQVHLFAGTIRSNIALGEPDASFERVEQAARLAHVHDDITHMPRGYDTPLMGGGESLSGGQRQRIALARALLLSPRILILDEATSQLDAETDRAIQVELAALRCTRIVIAHRLSTVVRATRCVVMEDGRIVEEGSHDELLRRGGPYLRLFETQLATVSRRE